MKAKQFNKLEVAIRILSPGGQLLSNYIIRENAKVEIINYFWNGEIQQHAVITLEQFVEELDKLREAKAG